ncbi:MAG: right-handed parallel beta-helix repeat-containing protein [Bacteroidota bacterium]
MYFRLVSSIILIASFIPAQSSIDSKEIERRVSVRNGSSEAIFNETNKPPQTLTVNATQIQPKLLRQTADVLLPWFNHPELSTNNEQINQLYVKLTAAAKQQSVATTFVVTNPGDDYDSNLSDNIFSPQTLRSAIENANKTPALDAISFSGVTSIQPVTELPVATTPIILDGSIAGGKVVLDGALMTNKNGLWIIGGTTVKNMKFTNWGSTALALAMNTGSGNNIVQSCEFYHNKGVGININTNNNLIGGMQPEEKNIVYDNVYNASNFRTGYGIAILNGNDNIVANNYIGTTDGVTASLNDNGLYVEGLRNKVYQNLISGNNYGLDLEGDYKTTGTNGNLVENNLIGTNAAGTGKLPNGVGIYFTDTNGDTIRSNIVSGNNGGIYGGSGSSKRMHIYNNAVGFNISRSDTLPNKTDGISVRGDFHLIEKNFVSGNRGNGIYMVDGDSSIIRNNKVGTDTSGKFPLGNRSSGIVLELARGCTVGGNSFSDANIIAANGEAGVKIHYSSGNIVTSNNRVMHNYIGTNAANDSGLGNFYGVTVLRNAPRNIIESNVISRNKRHGIYIYRFLQTGDSTFIRKNFIGTDATATLSMGNDSAGVMIEEGFGNIIGGNNASDGNTIMYNGIDGVFIKKGTGNTILSNIIKKNKQLSIDLGDEGSTVNDNSDSDAGANNLQNYPVITFIKVSGANTTVTGMLKSTPLKSFKIQFYSHEKPDSTGFGEGDEYHQTETVNTDSSGTAKFIITISGMHQRVVATATDPDGNTSEFSKSPIIVNSNGDASDINAVDGFADTGGPSVNGAPEVTLRAAIQTAQHLKGEDYISFDIPGNLSTNFISPASALPTLDFSGVTIDGTTQSGFSTGSNKISINGTQAGNVDGLETSGSLSVIKALDISNFQQNGISVSGNDLRVENCRLSSNMLNGIYAGENLHLIGKIFALNSGGGNNGSCSPGSTRAGIWVNKNLFADSVEATNNCGSGIHSEQGNVSVHGSLNVSNNSEDGINSDNNIEVVGPSIVAQSNKFHGLRAHKGNILLKSTGALSQGFSIQLNNNGGSGAYAYQELGLGRKGIVEVYGKLQVNNNGPSKVEVNFNGDAGIYAANFIRVDEVEVKNNRGYGLFSPRGRIEIYGNAVINNNERLGVLSQFGLIMNGRENSISGNKEEAVYIPNGNMTVNGKISLLNNNKKNCSENPNEWLPLDTDRFTSLGGPGGIGAQSLNLQDADISGNCGAGISTWIYVHVSGRINVLNNSGNGIQTRNARIAGGRICENKGYGIRLWGATREVTAGFLELGSVQVCSNGLGGIKGVREKTEMAVRSIEENNAFSPASFSKISGSSITDNAGNGIEFDSYSQLDISKSNISGNGTLAIKNLDTSNVINAKSVWWGNSAGAGNSITGGVNASNWKTSPVSLTVSHSDDSTFNTAGSVDSVSVIVQNWMKPNDSILVNITETQGWLQSQGTITVVTKDSVPGLTNVLIKIPANAAPGDSTVIHITAQSLLDTTAKDADSFVVLSYQPALVRVFVLPDSVKLLKGDSVQFTLNGYDQANKPFKVNTLWKATGGTIDSLGVYTAGSMLGIFSVTGTDSISGLIASSKVVIVNSLTPVEKESVFPMQYSLHQNYPNPFNPSTTIRFNLPSSNRVVLRVYDILGREVRTLLNEERKAGLHTVQFDGSKLSTGVYIYSLRAGDFFASKKLMFMK